MIEEGRRARSASRRLGPPLALLVATLAAVAVTVSLQGRAGGGPAARPLDRDPSSALARAVDRAPGLGAGDLARLREVAAQPTATWLTGDAAESAAVVQRVVRGAERRRTTPVLVLYRIPHRDCGSYSKLAGTVTAAGYRAWLHAVVGALGGTRALVVVEPDALAQLDCLGPGQADERLGLLRAAVDAVAAQGSWAYLDAGHAGWIPAARMSARLRAAGAERARGISVNVSAFGATADETAYGERVAAGLGDAHLVVDTSRNGARTARGQWCNPPSARLGRAPTFDTGRARVDAYLWIKTPGLSDGPCSGGPAAGTFWPEGALRLIRGGEAG